MWLQVPGFIEDSMVTRFDDAGGHVEIHYVSIGCCVPQEVLGEVMSVQFTMPRARLFDAQTMTKIF